MAGVRQFDEEKVLSAVLDVFWRKGWHSTSMADLAEAAEVQRGSLYHAYGGKEALFLLAFEAYTTRFLDNAAKALEAADAETALRQFFQVAISNLTSGTPPKGCLTTKTATDVDTIGPRIQQRLRDLLDALQLTISTALSAEPIQGDLALAPDEVAQVMVTFTRGLAVMERIYQEPERLRSTADSLVRLLVPSVRARA